MNIEVRAKERTQTSKLSIIDCDFHPRLTHEQMKPFLTNQWWSYLQTYGNRQRHGQAKGYNYPKIVPQASRRDAWPPSGGPPGSDVSRRARMEVTWSTPISWSWTIARSAESCGEIHTPSYSGA